MVKSQELRKALTEGFEKSKKAYKSVEENVKHIARMKKDLGKNEKYYKTSSPFSSFSFSSPASSFSSSFPSFSPCHLSLLLVSSLPSSLPLGPSEMNNVLYQDNKRKKNIIAMSDRIG